VLADVIRLLPTRCGYSGSTVLLCHGYLPDTCWIYTRICCGYLRVFSRVCRVSTRKSGIYPPLVFIPHACILAITTVTVNLPFIKQRTKPRQVCRVLTRNQRQQQQPTRNQKPADLHDAVSADSFLKTCSTPAGNLQAMCHISYTSIPPIIMHHISCLIIKQHCQAPTRCQSTQKKNTAQRTSCTLCIYTMHLLLYTMHALQSN